MVSWVFGNFRSYKLGTWNISDYLIVFVSNCFDNWHISVIYIAFKFVHNGSFHYVTLCDFHKDFAIIQVLDLDSMWFYDLEVIRSVS